MNVMFLPVSAQERCATVHYMDQLRKEGKVKQSEEQFEQWLDVRLQKRKNEQQALRTQGSSYEIPVVIHVIHNGEDIGTGTNISDEQIFSQIEVLNQDFNRLNADAVNTPPEFAAVAGSMTIEFVLARRDPDGLPTTGINRVQGTKTSWTLTDNATFKALSYWPSDDYLNIWVIKFSGNFVGYAQFPVSNLLGLDEYQNGLASTDGVVVDYTAFGTIDAGTFPLDPSYNKGRTATHEIGHFFGLRHIWGDATCGDDYVADTPLQRSSTTNCPSHPQTTTCGTPIVKMFQNFMDYTDDACMNLYTAGQISRMELILDDLTVPRRNSLLNSPGLLDPDCDRIDVVLQRIESPAPISCTDNSSIRLNVLNRSCFPLTSITVEYIINQDAIRSSTITLPEPLEINKSTIITLPPSRFQLNENSVFVTITHANDLPDEDNTNSSETRKIIVDKSADRIPLRENFDTFTWPTISPQDGINWELTTTNFGTSATVQASDQGIRGTEAWLATPVLDFSSAFKASVFFDYSYGFNGTESDRLKVVASTNCGNTYPITLFDRLGSALATVTTSLPWQPSQAEDWRQKTFINLNSLAGLKNVRLAFVFTNATGNNVYVDNIEFFLSDNPNPVDVSPDFYSVYWNTNAHASVTFNLPERMPVRIQIVDILGRSFIDTSAPDILNQTFPIDLGGASSGIYFLRVQATGLNSVTKFYLSN
jgi:hypothetical protein